MGFFSVFNDVLKENWWILIVSFINLYKGYGKYYWCFVRIFRGYEIRMLIL